MIAPAHTCLEQLVGQHPTDRIALWQLNQMQIAQGNYRGGLVLARRSLEACPHEPVFQTMTGFFLEQSGYNEEGLTLSLRSLATDPTSLYTYHAVGHAYQSRGDYRQALSTFERAASLERYPHILWHLAEMNAILGYERFTRDYWASTSPALPLFERIELMWRLEIIRHAPVDTAMWQALATQGECLLQQGDYLTIWMHHWIGVALARAGRWDKAQQQQAFLRRLPEALPAAIGPRSALTYSKARWPSCRGLQHTALDGPSCAPYRRYRWGQPRTEGYFSISFSNCSGRQYGPGDCPGAAALLANPWHLQSLAALPGPINRPARLPCSGRSVVSS